MTDFDDQLRSELDRRAESVELPREWARHDLLPAVMSGIETRPQRVAASRAPAFAGLAAAVAIVLVMVVALPRVGPGAGTPQPTQEVPPSTISSMGTSTFAARLATGELNGQTLLVTGEVITSNPRAGGLCPASPNDYCLVGTLAGSDIDLMARPYPVPEGEGDPLGEGTGAWDWWRMRSPPTGVSRSMAVSVNDNGTVQLLGYTPQDVLLTTLGEFDGIDLRTVSPDEVRVVNAWLTAQLLEPSCPEPQEATYISELPGRFCGGPDWLYDEPVPPGGPHGEGLAIQNGAYEEFAPNPTLGQNVGEPRSGSFVVAKRLEGYCEGNRAPCWAWEVVGRLTVDDPSTAEPQQPTFMCDASDLNVNTDPDRRPVVLDETGLVESCEAVVSTTPNTSGLWITNLIGDSTVLHVEWSGNPCDLGSTFTFSSFGDGYQLNGRRPNVGCIEPLVRHAMRIHLTEEVDAATVTGSMLPDGPVGPRTFPPTAEPPVPTPDVANRFECTGPPSPPDMTFAPAPHPVVIDETGLVVSCLQADVSSGYDTLTVRDVEGDNRIHIEWPSGTCDGSIVFTFSYSPDSSGYELSGERPTVCPGDQGSLPVEIVFRQPVAAADVQAILDGVAPAPTATPVSRTFECEPEPAYDGPGGDRLRAIIHDETGLLTGACRGLHGAVETARIPAVNPQGDLKVLQLNWSGSPCDAEIDVTLSRLDDGGYLARGIRGDPGCILSVGALHSLVIQLSAGIDAADVIVQIDDPPAVPLPTPGTALLCEGAAEADYPVPTGVVDTTGFVQRCEAVAPPLSYLTTEQNVQVDNPGGDPNFVRVAWSGGACDSPMTIHFEPTGDGYDVWSESDREPIPESTPGPCDAIGIVRAVQFELSQPIDSDQVNVR